MRLEKYKRIRSAVLVAIVVLTAYGVIQNSIFMTLLAVTFGIVALYILRRGLTEIAHDERTNIISSKANSATLAIITVGMAIIGLLLIFLSGQGIGNYEQAGYLLAFQASIISVLNALLYYYYRNKLGG
ncbi:DUF2178 domain-containing protein [Candidatus Bathyarchaeota archaeon]|nr:DUF2178 domain-containing protein [Candidatus Bathyarchaeota archaeon]